MQSPGSVAKSSRSRRPSYPRPVSGERGDLTLTGQLGDVMKEPAEIALSHVRAHAEEIDPAGRDRPRAVQLHVLSCAIQRTGRRRE